MVDITRSRPGVRVPSPPQDLPVLRATSEDRLQGRASAAALHFRARQDRAFRALPPSARRSSASSPGDQGACFLACCLIWCAKNFGADGLPSAPLIRDGHV